MSMWRDFNDERKRIADMLESVDDRFDRTTTGGKAAIVRAITGSIEPMQEMAAICSCGWRGRFKDIDRVTYDSGPESWIRHAGRSGWHYPCPNCGEVIWRYYNIIN